MVIDENYIWYAKPPQNPTVLSGDKGFICQESINVLSLDSNK